MWDRDVVPTPEEDLPPSSAVDQGGPSASSPSSPKPRSLPPAPEVLPCKSRAEPEERRTLRRYLQALAELLLRGVATCPGMAALSALAVLGTLAGVGLAYLPPKLERGFDILADSDVDSALLQSAFAASVAENSQSSQRRADGVSTAYRIFDVCVTYELKDPGLEDGFLNLRALKEVASFERSLVALPGWRSTCEMAEERDRVFCQQGLSFVNYALASPNVSRGQVLPRSLSLDGRSEDSTALPAALHTVGQHGLSSLLLPADFDADQGQSLTALRSAFRFKLPLDGSPGAEVEAAERQLQAAWEQLLREELLPVMEAAQYDEEALFRADVAGAAVRELEYSEALLMDAALAAGVVVLAFLYLVWYTRSIFLGTAAVSITTLALPISHTLFALGSGSTRVGALSLVSVFCTLAVGVDAVLVYTDHWWDSASREVEDMYRLQWTYKLAGRSTLATTTATALTFFAILASILRPLREFGLFTGFCVLVTWLLVSLVYPPLCVLGDRHCAACRLYTATSKAIANKAEEQNLETADDGRLGSQTFAALMPKLRFARCPACLLPVLASVSFCYIALWKAKPSLAVPQLLPEGHPARRGERVAARFAEVGEVFGASLAPLPREEEVCSEQRFRADDPQRCTLFWCEAGPQQVQPANGSCACRRRERTGCGHSAHASAVQRLVGFRPALDSDLAAAAGAFLAAEAAAGLVSVGSVATELLPPMLMQEWENQNSTLAPVTQVSAPLLRMDAARSSCGWDDLCFCGRAACRLPPDAWRQVSRPFPHLPQFAAAVPVRRSLAERGPVVHVVFGLKVHQKMLLLGEKDMASTWSFTQNFDIRQPAAQRDLQALCSNMPSELLVAEKRCWMDDFLRFLAERRQGFPVLASHFDDLFAEFLRGPRVGGSSDRHFWLREGEVKACFVSFSLGLPRTAGAAEILQLKKRWDSYLQAFNAVASIYMHGAFHTSELWVQAELQGALLSSCALVAGVALVLGFASTLIFTQNLILPALVTMNALGAVSGAAFFAVVGLGWSIGPLEVIVLLSFTGPALHAALHVACAYSSSEALAEALAERPVDGRSAARYHRTGYALKSVGSSLLGSGLASASGFAFLAFGQLTLFRKLGRVMPVLVLLSVFNALLPLPAGLLMCGPASLTQKRMASMREVRQLLWRAARCVRRGCSCRRRGAEGGHEAEASAPGTHQVQAAPPSCTIPRGWHEPWAAPDARTVSRQQENEPSDQQRPVQEEIEEERHIAMAVSTQVPIASQGAFSREVDPSL